MSRYVESTSVLTPYCVSRYVKAHFISRNSGPWVNMYTGRKVDHPHISYFLKRGTAFNKPRVMVGYRTDGVGVKHIYTIRMDSGFTQDIGYWVKTPSLRELLLKYHKLIHKDFGSYVYARIG